MITTTFNFTTPSGFNFTDTEITGGVAQQTSPFQLEASLIMAQSIKVRLFSAFTAVITEATPSHTVTFIVEDDGVLKYWSGAAWVVSDGSAAESNTLAEMNTNLPSLITDLSTHEIKFKIVFKSPDTIQTSSLDSFAITFVSGFNICNVFVSLCELTNTAPVIDPLNPPKLYVSNDRGFLQGCNAVYPFSKSVAFNASGQATISVMETETTGERLEFVITFPSGDSIDSFRFPPSVVPNAPWANLSDIVNGSAVDSDFQVRAGSVPLPNMVKTRVVNYLSDIGGADYGMKANLANLVDVNPLLTPEAITQKTSLGFTSKWSADTDSASYFLDYLSVLNKAVSITSVMSGSQAIAKDLYQKTVTFPDIGTLDYAPMAMLTNIIDGSIQFMPLIVIQKTQTSFTALWSSKTDTANYKLDFIVRDNCSNRIFQGRRWQSGSIALASGVKTKSVVFAVGMGTTQYAAFGIMSNVSDGSPIIQPLMPVTKVGSGCDFIWSSNTDSINYVLEYIVVETF